MLLASEAEPDQPICVAGPHAVDLMCALLQRDFARVELAWQRTCSCADEKCDVLLIPGGACSGDIIKTAQAVVSILRPGSPVVIATHELQGEGEQERLRDLLSLSGFTCPVADDLQVILRACLPDARTRQRACPVAV